MSDAQVRWFTTLSGGAAFVLYLISALLILDVPSIGSTSQALAQYSAGHSTSLLLEVVVWGPATCATIAFAIGLWVLLRRAEGEPGLLAMLFLAAIILTEAIVLGGFPELLVLGYRGSVLAPSDVRLLIDLTYLGVALSAFPTILATGTYAVLVFRTAAFPLWTAWLAVLVAALHLIGGISFAASGALSPSGIGVFVAPPAFYLWILAVSVVVVRSKPQEPRATT
jgi:hypothetical protein